MWKQIHVFAAVVFLILAIAPLAGASADCDFSYSNYARAVQLHDMGDYDAALRHYHCALEEDPDDGVIPLLIANVHEDIANAGAAWSSTESLTTAEILGLPPVSTWGLRSKPDTELDFDDLIVVESASSEVFGDHPRPAAMAMSIAFGQGEMDDVDRGGDSSLGDEYIRQARIFARNLDWTRARIRFEQALALDPERMDIRCELGMVYQEFGEERSALRQYDMVLAQDPIDACARPNRDALMRLMRDG